jgi:hypothetical protein
MYHFTVSGQHRVLLEGRAAVVLDAKRLTRTSD